MDLAPPRPYAVATPVRLGAVPLLARRHHAVRLGDLRGLFDTGYAALGAALAAAGAEPAGPALAVYRGDPAAAFDLDIAFPVPADAAAPEGHDVVVTALPAGPALASSHLGGYEGLGEAWGMLAAAAGASGETPTGTWVEVYVTDPSTGTAPLRTDLLLALR